MPKKTAIEYLFQQLEGYEYNRIKRKNSLADSIKHLESLKEKAKAMEKEQIIDAWKDAEGYNDENAVILAKQYYNETYEGGQDA